MGGRGALAERGSKPLTKLFEPFAVFSSEITPFIMVIYVKPPEYFLPTLFWNYVSLKVLLKTFYGLKKYSAFKKN